MKKFISMLLCLAMVLSLCAVAFAAETTSATISFDDAANRTVFTTEQQVWVQNGITVTNDKAASTSNVADYAKPARFYKNSKLTVAYPGMTVIEFECNTASYATALKNSITTGTATVNGKIVGVTLDAAADSYVIEALSGGQVRIDKITVYTGGAPETPDEPVVVPATLAEQIAEANKLANKEYLPYQTTITGTITNDPLASSYTAGAYDFTVSDGTNSLRCYFVPVTGGTPAKGDTVTVTGYLTAYNGAAQYDDSATATIVQKGEPETPVEPEDPTAGIAGTLTETLANGDKVVIYYPASQLALTGNANGKKLSGTAATVTGNTLASAEAAVFEVIVDTNGYYSFVLDGKYMTSGTTGNSLSMADAASDYSLWALESTDGGYFIKSVNAAYNGKAQYIEYYSGFTTYGMGSNTALYTYQFFKVTEGGTTPDVPDVPEEPEQPEQPEQPSGNRADFETLNSEGYGQYTQSFTTANGWTTVNSAIQVGGPSVANPAFPVVGADNTHKAVCLNGKTSAVGKLTSPTLTGGISKLTMDYTKMFTDTKLSVTITITDLATGKTYTQIVARDVDKDNDKYVVWNYEWVLETPITGDFTIEVVNNCPSASTSNKDRFTILNLAWESAGGSTEPEVNPDEEAAKAVDAQIEAIGEVTLEKETAITAARAAYEALSDAAKALVTKLETLTAAETELAAQKKAAADKAAADAVVAQINAIGEVTLNSKAAIDAARAAYEALTADQKALVTKLDALTAAETRLQELKDAAAQAAADKAAADAAAALIEKIGTVTKDSEAAIDAARAAYDALTDAQKALVENYETLTKAEEAFKGIANTGDNTMMFVAMAILSMTAVVVLVSKKRAF